MDLNIKLIPERGLLQLRKSDADLLDIGEIRFTVVRFGFSITDINIQINEDVPANMIYISEDVYKHLRLPKSNSYLIKIKNKEIVIGPYIGVYLGNSYNNIKWKFPRLASFVSEYSDINGVVCAFTAEDIDLSSMEVNCYYFNSDKKIWNKKVMPLPTVIQRYGSMNKKIGNTLKGIYGDKLFNYKEMDKWAEMRMLQQSPDTSLYIPETTICHDIKTFKRFLTQYNKFYFKPIKGRKGQGIHKIEKKSNEKYVVTIQYSRHHEEQNFNTEKELITYLKTHIISSEYILQTAIDIIFDNRTIDFRIRFDKNIDNEWILSLFVARISGENGIVSNRSAGGTVESPDTALTKYYAYSDKDIKIATNNLVTAGLKIAKVVDKSNLNLGKIAIDLGMESDGRIWHFESNLVTPNDRSSYAFEGENGIDKVGHLNMLYSKRLTGFSELNNKVKLTNSDINNMYEENLQQFTLIISGQVRRKKFNNLIEEVLQKYDNIIYKNSSRYTLELSLLNTSQKDMLKFVHHVREKDSLNLVRAILCKRENID